MRFGTLVEGVWYVLSSISNINVLNYTGIPYSHNKFIFSDFLDVYVHTIYRLVFSDLLDDIIIRILNFFSILVSIFA